MARFVKVGNSGTMINVEQITSIYQNGETSKYEVNMASGMTHFVTYDEFLEITGKQQHQSDNNKKCAVRVFRHSAAPQDVSYLNFNHSTINYKL